VLKQIQIREWIFSRMEEDGTILIVLKGGDFGLDVKVDDIGRRIGNRTNTAVTHFGDT